MEVCGRRLFSASADKTIRVWDIESRRCEQVMEDHTRPVLSLSVANGKLFSGSYDYTIKVRPSNWKEGHQGHRSMLLSHCSCPRMHPPASPFVCLFFYVRALRLQ